MSEGDGRELLNAAFEQGGFPIYLTGMSDESLRDYFAGQALEGMRSTPTGWGTRKSEELAKKAYDDAKAMMDERKRREEGKDGE